MKLIFDECLSIEAIPKGRPRFNGKWAYTPARTKNYETALKILLKRAYKGSPLLKDVPIRAEVAFHFKRPKQPSREFPACDTDNLVKAILDAANEILFEDDSAVCEIFASKRWDVTSFIDFRLFVI